MTSNIKAENVLESASAHTFILGTTLSVKQSEGGRTGAGTGLMRALAKACALSHPATTPQTLHAGVKCESDVLSTTTSHLPYEMGRLTERLGVEEVIKEPCLRRGVGLAGKPHRSCRV